MNTPLPSLYTLTAEYMAVAQKLSETDLDPQTIADTLEGLAGDLETKAINVGKFIKTLDATVEQIKAAEKEMAERRKAMEARAKHVRDYLLNNMQACGISKIESPWFALSVKQNPPSVVIDDAGEIPCDLYIYPEAPPPYPDKAGIKAAIKAGRVVNGAHLEHGVRLEIK